MLRAMSPERVLFAFVIVLALTLNAGFCAGTIDEPAHHNVYELYAALVVSLVATVMKFGDRSPLASMVADLQLVAAAVAWGWLGSEGAGMAGAPMATVVSLALGALVANLISVVLLVVEVANLRR